MTDENWPLIGPMGVEGTFVAGAMSGFGTMAACASGELCAQWILGVELPEYAKCFSPDRYDSAHPKETLPSRTNRGIL
jgi:glycine/D-amino acid oxidase-like deaminating enzyme